MIVRRKCWTALVRNAFLAVTVVLALGVRLPANAQSHGTSAARPGVIVDRETVYEMDERDASVHWVASTADGRHFALVINEKDKQQIYHDGVQGPRFEKIVYVEMHPESGLLAYIGVEKNDLHVYVNDAPLGRFVRFDDSITFSPDGERYLFLGVKKGSLFDKDLAALGGAFGTNVVAVLDGVSKKYDAITGLTSAYFSNDGSLCGYSARKGKTRYVVINNDKGRGYEQTAAGPVFSEDGRHYAYAGYRHDTAYVVVDGVERGGYTYVGEIALSADGAQVAYSAQINFDKYLIVDDRQIGPFQSAREPVFSPDGRVVACVVQKDSLMHALIDSTCSPGYAGVSIIVFCPGGTRYAYSVITTADEDASSLQHMVVDGVPQSAFSYAYVNTFRFSDDCRRTAYVGGIDSLRQVAVIDGNIGTEYRHIWPPVFAPGGGSVAYTAQCADEQYCVVRDGKESSRFALASLPVFSPDGSHLAYFALDRGSWKLFLDESVVDLYGKPALFAPRFTDDRTVVVLSAVGQRTVSRITAAVQ